MTLSRYAPLSTNARPLSSREPGSSTMSPVAVWLMTLFPLKLQATAMNGRAGGSSVVPKLTAPPTAPLRGPAGRMLCPTHTPGRQRVPRETLSLQAQGNAHAPNPKTGHWYQACPYTHINFVFLFNIVRILMTKLRASTTSETIQYRKAVKATLVLLPLLGITYMLFFVNPGEDDISQIVFIYFNSFLQSFQMIWGMADGVSFPRVDVVLRRLFANAKTCVPAPSRDGLAAPSRDGLAAPSRKGLAAPSRDGLAAPRLLQQECCDGTPVCSIS
ncbi:hypothetical protein CRUP_034847, partial [Coryphaenoides rupestris]